MVFFLPLAAGPTKVGAPSAMPANERPTVRAHRELAAVLRPGDLAVDATAGNGHDTVFLAERVGESGRVIAFDIQAAAIESSRARVIAQGLEKRVSFIHGSHGTLLDHVAAGSVAAVVFNLGYLPGGDHSLITQEAETLLALDRAWESLKADGLLAIVCYPGHPGGDRESEAVVKWSAGFGGEVIRREDTLRPAPFLVLLRK